MDSVETMAMRAAVRMWNDDQHRRNILHGEWLDMYDSDGNKLTGIRGRMGAVGLEVDGTDVGVDCIEMQPGTSFLPHVHDGNHILFIESGTGSLSIEGGDGTVIRPLSKGDSVFIAGSCPHAVTGPALGETEPLVIIAFGHPHKHVSARDRMKHPEHHHEHGHTHSHDHEH